MDNNLDIVKSDTEKIEGNVLSKLVNDIVYSEEDYFMDILSVVQKYRTTEFKTIISNILENEQNFNYILYAKKLKNIIEHLLNIIKNNNLDNLPSIILVQNDNLYLLSEQLNKYIRIISETQKNKEIVGTELCIISAILNNMYDELLGVFIKKCTNTWTGSEWVSDEE